MAIQNVNPTRMEMKRLKERLKTATRGHKLLKDKTDEMVRQFIVLARENKRLREQVEDKLSVALKNFLLAKSVSDTRVVEEALLTPSRTLTLSCTQKNFMNIGVPSITIDSTSQTDLFPYSFLSVTSQLDDSVSNLNDIVVELIQLAEIEKTCNMLADEIEKNKRRVNALENILIPDMQDTIKYIKMKLDENERSATVRLMKVKDIIAKQQYQS